MWMEELECLMMLFCCENNHFVKKPKCFFMKVITIGRSSQNDVTINDSKVSRHHCQIIQHDDRSFSLSEFGSTNGTYVNGRRVYGEVRLNPNDEIIVGNTIVRWRTYFNNSTQSDTKTLPILLGVVGALLLVAVIIVVVVMNNNGGGSNSISTVESAQQVSDNRANTQETTTNLMTKPDEGQIAMDLVGHSLTEGKENGYYPSSWSWMIEEGQVSNVKILSVEEDNSSFYRVVVSMRLSSNTRAFDCKAVIAYKLDNVNGWQIDMVKSRGMDIVKTHRYDDCISIGFRSSFAFTQTLHAINSCDVSLEIGGSYLCSYDNKWTRFCIVVSPNSEKEIDYSAQSDWQIDYIERP